MTSRLVFLMAFRLKWAIVFAAFAVVDAACAADSPISQAVAKLEQNAAQAPKPLAMEFRLRGAQALQVRYPELARKLINLTLEELRPGKNAEPGPAMVQELAEVAPADAVALWPQLGPGARQVMIGALVSAGRVDDALALFRSARAKDEIPAIAVSPLLAALVKEKPAEAGALYKETVATFGDPLSPSDAFWLINVSPPLANALRDQVADSYERVIRAASASDYGRDAKIPLTGSLQMGTTSIPSDNTRDTLLILAGSRLGTLAPERFEKYRETFARWKFTGPAMLRGAGPPQSPEIAAISRRIGTMRGLPSDADRAQLVKALIPEIRALPAGFNKLNLIRGLGGVSTEGDLGKEALAAVAVTLATALRESYPQMAAAKQSWPFADGYLELAKLVRYEHLAVPFETGPDPSLDAAQAVLALREHVQQENGFTLTSLDGKTYTLAGMKGKIVLLNFWATWCPPCRKEMPDMEKLYRAYQGKGLTVIAVSDEDRETVVNFLAKNSYTFPIALDPGGKVSASFFASESIPKSFIFDREGRLAAQTIDMRTGAQFLELLKMAGLE